MIAAELRKLGFVSATPPFEKGDGDFAVFDDSDGNGPYIRYWLSDKPCPFPELQREPAILDDSDFREKLAAQNEQVFDPSKAVDIVREAIAQVQAVTVAAEKEIAKRDATIEAQAKQISILMGVPETKEEI